MIKIIQWWKDYFDRAFSRLYNEGGYQELLFDDSELLEKQQKEQASLFDDEMEEAIPYAD